MFGFQNNVQKQHDAEDGVRNVTDAVQWLATMARLDAQMPGYHEALGARVLTHYAPIFGDARRATEDEDIKTRRMVYLSQSHWLQALADERWIGEWGGYDAHAMRFLGFLSLLRAEKDDPNAGLADLARKTFADYSRILSKWQGFL